MAEPNETPLDLAQLRALWYVNPQEYRRIVKENGLEPAQLWPTKAQLPADHALQSFPAGAFGLTLALEPGVARAKAGPRIKGR